MATRSELRSRAERLERELAKKIRARDKICAELDTLESDISLLREQKVETINELRHGTFPLVVRFVGIPAGFSVMRLNVAETFALDVSDVEVVTVREESTSPDSGVSVRVTYGVLYFSFKEECDRAESIFRLGVKNCTVLDNPFDDGGNLKLHQASIEAPGGEPDEPTTQALAILFKS